MLVHTLLHRLKSSFGEPTQFERQDAYRWEIRALGAGGHVDIHLCLTLEEQTQKAAIWLFDPRAADHNRARCFYIDNERAMAEALQFLDERLPQAALIPLINVPMSDCANGAIGGRASGTIRAS